MRRIKNKRVLHIDMKINSDCYLSRSSLVCREFLEFLEREKRITDYSDSNKCTIAHVFTSHVSK